MRNQGATSKYFFHATRKMLPVDQVLRGRPRKIPEIGQSVESLLEGLRPEQRPSRTRAIFLCRRLEDCAVYMEAQVSPLSGEGRAAPPVHYYRVTVDEAVAAPMILVDHARRLLEAGLPAEEVAHEYWSPSPGWRWMECLALVCIVLEEVSAPELVDKVASRERYGLDLDRAMNLFPLA